MLKRTLIFGVVASCAALLSWSDPSFAQQKAQQAKQAKQPVYGKSLSYEEAWARCKKFVDQGVVSWDQTSQRYARGAACMAKFGHRI